MNKQNSWILIASISITAVVVGGIVYAWQSSEKSFQEQITLLQSQINYLQEEQDNHNEQHNQNTIQAPVTEEQNEQPEEIVYDNSQYGFTVTFPQTWKEYTTKNRTLDWGSIGTSDSVDFGFAIQDSLFNISIYTKSQWEDITSAEGPGTPTYLGENNEYVFAYGTAQYAENDMMIARMSEIQDIVKTFQIK